MEYLFETAHLKVRKFAPEDAPALYHNHLQMGVRKWFPNECYADIEEAREAVSFYRECVDAGKLPYVLAVELKETGEMIGDTGVNETDAVPDMFEIGYVICEKYSGRGYATELVAAMTEYMRETFQFDTLYGRVLRGNHASARVLEKNGYVFEGEEFGAEDDPYGNGMLVYRSGNRELGCVEREENYE